MVAETGAGLPDANSYVSEAEALQDLPSSVIGEWNALTADGRADRLVAASGFIDVSFGWVGKRKTLGQGLSWPRVGVTWQGHAVPDDTVPRPVKRACIAALLMILAEGADVFRSMAEPPVKRERFSVMDTEYFDPRPPAVYESPHADINKMLSGLYAPPSKGGVISAEVLRV